MRRGDYPTPAQISLYLGGIWLDDAYRVEFRKQNPKTPLYGYDEKYFSNVAEGQVIVSGNLILNYRYPGYLWAVVNSHLQKITVDPKQTATTQFAADLLRMSPAKRIEAIRDARQTGSLNRVGSIMTELLNKNSNITTARSTPDLVGRLLKDGRGGYYPIDIDIYFDKPVLSWYRKRIVDVHFTGNSMTMSGAGQYGGDSSASGQPIYEVYSFFAKNVKDIYSEQYNRSRNFAQANEIGSPDATDNLVHSYEKESQRWA